MGKEINDIARYTLLSLQIKGISVSPLKLQKILYYIQSWHLVYFSGDPLFDDKAEAWANGPVYRKVYETYKGLPRNQELKSEYDEEAKYSEELEKIKKSLDLSDKELSFLNSIFIHYGTMSQERLVFLTHSEKPWNIAREGLSPFEYSDNIITHESMQDYYSSLNKK